MQFKSIALVLACATGLMAFPSEAFPSNEYVELSREAASNTNGTLIYLGPTSGTKTKRWFWGKPPTCSNAGYLTCGSDNDARNDICDQLVSELYADATYTVGEAPRQICYLGAAAEDNAYCCVSWHNVVKNLVKGDLADHANNILKQCTSDGISGKLNAIWVDNVCTDVCLSNRGNNC